MKTPILILLASIATAFAQVDNTPKPAADPFAAKSNATVAEDLLDARITAKKTQFATNQASIEKLKAELFAAEAANPSNPTKSEALNKELGSLIKSTASLEDELRELDNERTALRNKALEYAKKGVPAPVVPIAKPAADPNASATPKPQPPATPRCDVDLKKTAQMKDVISNVLMRAEHKPEPEVQAFLKDAVKRSATGDDLLKAAAEHFKIDQKRLAELVEQWRHVNCKHAAIPSAAADPFIKAGAGTPTLSGENTFTRPAANTDEPRPTNYQVLFETFDFSREDFLALLDEKGDDDARYRRVGEWMTSGRAKLATFSAITARSGQRVTLESSDDVRYPTRFEPTPSDDGATFPTQYETRNVGDSLELELSVEPDGQTASVSLAPKSTTLLNFADQFASPGQPSSAVSQPQFSTRVFVTNVTTTMSRPRLVGTLTGTSDDAAPASQIRVAFLTTRRNAIPAPQPADIVKDATQSRNEYTFFSLERPAARDLFLNNPEPQACYDGLRSLVAEKKARLEHVSINTTRFGQQTRSDESRGVALASDWNHPKLNGPATAANFEIKSAGFSCQMEPQMAADGATIDINYSLEFVRSLGALQVTGIAKTYPPQPLIETRKLNANVTTTAGKQQFIGTFNLPNESGVNGRKDDGRVCFGFVRPVLVK